MFLTTLAVTKCHGGNSLTFTENDEVGENYHESDENDRIGDNDVLCREFRSTRLTASPFGCKEAFTAEQGSAVDLLTERVTKLERQRAHLVEPPSSRLAKASTRINDLEHQVTVMRARLGNRAGHIDENGEHTTTSGLFGDVSSLSIDVKNALEKIDAVEQQAELRSAEASRRLNALDLRMHWAFEVQDGLGEHKRDILKLRKEVDDSVRVLTDETKQNQAALHWLQEMVEAELRDWKHAVDDLSDTQKALADALSDEVMDRMAGDDENAKNSV